MILNLFILGCLKEKPLHLDFLLETANFIKLDKWTTYKNDLLLDKLNTLIELNYIKISKEKNHHSEKYHYISTEIGVNYFRKELEKYIESEEVNIGMLLLFLTFSNHFSKEEIILLLDKKIEILNSNLNELKEINPEESTQYSSPLGFLSLKTNLNFRINEIILYEDLLKHIKDNFNTETFYALSKEFI